MSRQKKSIVDPLKPKSKKREPGYYTLKISNQDKTVFYKSHLSKEDFCKAYFKNIEANIQKHPEYNSEQLLDAYKKLWDKYKLECYYTDSWEHIWSDTKPSDKVMLEYISGLLK